jgi:hypothetical protein
VSLLFVLVFVCRTEGIPVVKDNDNHQLSPTPSREERRLIACATVNKGHNGLHDMMYSYIGESDQLFWCNPHYAICLFSLKRSVILNQRCSSTPEIYDTEGVYGFSIRSVCIIDSPASLSQETGLVRTFWSAHVLHQLSGVRARIQREKSIIYRSEYI